MNQITKSFLIKLLILTLLMLKIGDVMHSNLIDIATEQTVNSLPDEMETEVESEITFFQNTTNNPYFILETIFSVKAPVFKNTFSHNIHLIEFTTPPPENRF